MTNIIINLLKEILIVFALQDEFCIETYKKLSGLEASIENRSV